MRDHWPEYAIEAAGTAVFLLLAVGMTVLIEHPSLPVRDAVPHAVARRALMGLAMGTTVVLLVHSPWGKRSGAHFNPALTLAFWRLGRIAPADALGYGAAQFAGAVAGVSAAAGLLGALPADPPVRFAATLPGSFGAAAAFAAEVAISFGLVTTVLTVSSRPGLARWTGAFAGGLVALYITVEAPISGTSMNPARSLGSATGAGVFAHLWLYFLAPPLGMLLAAETWVRTGRAPRVRCAKLHHRNRQRCIFRCGYAAP